MWFEPISTWLVALLASGIPWLSEKTTKSIPAENWANKELHHKDIMDGVPMKEIIRRAEAGRYYIPQEIFDAYPVPHRNPNNNKIIIENYILYYDDVNQHGAYKAQRWVEQGKYNLTDEEKKMLEDQKKHRYTLKEFDYKNTRATQQWQKAHDAEDKYH